MQSIENSANTQISSMQNPNADKQFSSGRIVVKPPANFYRYSIYDELHLEKNISSEMISLLYPKNKNAKVKSKLKNVLSFIAKLAVTATCAVLVYKNRGALKNQAVNLYNNLKNLMKK